MDTFWKQNLRLGAPLLGKVLYTEYNFFKGVVYGELEKEIKYYLGCDEG
jgi:hypothetical protein